MLSLLRDAKEAHEDELIYTLGLWVLFPEYGAVIFLGHANQDKPSFHIPIIPDNREVESTGVGRELRFPGSYGSCKQSGFHVSRSRI